MPRLFHKNRSSHSLLSAQDVDERERDRNTARFQPSPTDSPIHSPAFPPSHPYNDFARDHSNEGDLDPNYTRTYRLDEVHAHQLSHHPVPPNQRTPGQIITTNLQQPTINLVGPTHSTPSSAIDEDPPDAFYRQDQQQLQHQQPPKDDKKKRRFFGLGGSSKETPAPTKLGRTISVRKKEQVPESGRFASQQDHLSDHTSPTDDFDDYGEGLAGPHNPHITTNPPAPDKEPLRSPGLPTAAARQDYSQHIASSGAHPSRRNPADKQVQLDLAGHSSWSRASSSVHHHTFSDASQSIAPLSAVSTSSHHFSQRSPGENLNQPWPEQAPSRPASRQSLEPPPPGQILRSQEVHHARSSSSQGSSLSHYTQHSMVHPPPPTGATRRLSEGQQDHPNTEQTKSGTYQPYAQGSQDRNTVQSNAPVPNSAQLASQTQPYRSSTTSTMQATGHEQGRSTPPPSRSRDDLSAMDLNVLQGKHDELRKIALWKLRCPTEIQANQMM